MTKRSLSRAQWTALGVAAAIIMAIVWLLSPRPVDVEVVAVHEGPIVEAVTDQGVMRVREAFLVSTPVAGRLERVSVHVGDRVAAGQIIARVHPMASEFLDARSMAQARAAIAAAQAAVTAADAAVRGAAAQRDLADQESTRQQTLAERGLVSRRALENAEAAARSAQSALQAAEAQARAQRAELAAAQAALIEPSTDNVDTLAIRAPVGGLVTRVMQESERPIPAGSPILEIGDRSGLEAAIEFLSQDAVLIMEGQTAEIFDWGGPHLSAIVRRVEPQAFTKISALGVEEQRVLVLLQITAPEDQWSRLAAGYRVWGQVALRSVDATPLIPIGALVRDGDSWATFVVEQGRARLRPLRLGAMSDDQAEILDGLAIGDQVIAYPADRVRDGVRVRARPLEGRSQPTAPDETETTE